MNIKTMVKRISALEIILLNTGWFGGGIAGVKIAQYAEWLALNKNYNESAFSGIYDVLKASPYFCGGAILGLAITIGAYTIIKNKYIKND